MDKKQPAPRESGIGGQALIEGIMMRSATVSALAVRLPDGSIVTESEPIPPKAKWKSWPFVRGVIGLGSSLYVGYRALMRSAELAIPPEEGDEKPPPMGVVAVLSLVLALGLSVGLFFILPALLSDLLKDYVTAKWAVAALDGGFRLLILVCYMLIMGLLKDIRRTFRYHGAEHKTIICAESGQELTVENARKCTRMHPRCGTSFMLWVMLISFIVFMFLGKSDNILWRIGTRLALLPVVASISYEFLKLTARSDNLFSRILRAPGLWLQRLTTYEPDDAMIEVAIAAYNACLPTAEGEETEQIEAAPATEAGTKNP